MKFKTDRLLGARLDWAVAVALGHKLSDDGSCIMKFDGYLGWDDFPVPGYNTDWAEAGPILEREKIKVFPNVGGTWSAQIRHETTHPLVPQPVLDGWTNASGKTPVIAAMRCFVKSKLGDEVDVPEELC